MKSHLLPLFALAVLAPCGRADEPPAVPAARADQAAQARRDAHAEDLARDVELGRRYAAEVEKQYRVSKNSEYQERVQRIGSELAAIANSLQPRVLWGDPRKNAFEYTFKVLEGKDVNAFSLPGGFIYVYEGLIEYAESDDELAGVLAHEIAHAAFRHLATLQREQSRLQAITLPMILVAIFSGGQATGDLMMLGQLVGLAAGSGWSQQAEQAADDGGLQYMLKSRYNPVGILTFMERLAVDERNRPKIDWGIYRTHPPSRDRAMELAAKIRAAGVPIERSKVTRTFRALAEPGKAQGSVEIRFNGSRIATLAGPDALARAEKACSKLNAFFDRVPELFQVSAREDGRVVGLGKELFRITADDASLAGQSVEDAAFASVQAIKRSLYFLSYRIWEIR
ncbi:MAG: M48 family metalloprotease [Fimbriimonadales bacterium]|nr:M48 family metalloprotease [Fimbriimonadales bacterium]